MATLDEIAEYVQKQANWNLPITSGQLQLMLGLDDQLAVQDNVVYISKLKCISCTYFKKNMSDLFKVTSKVGLTDLLEEMQQICRLRYCCLRPNYNLLLKIILNSDYNCLVKVHQNKIYRLTDWNIYNGTKPSALVDLLFSLSTKFTQ